MRRIFKLALLWLFKLSGLLRLARRIAYRRGFLIIGWHGVSIADEHTRFPSLFLSPEALRGRLRFLKRNFEIVTLEEALRQHAAGSIAGNMAVLTFDDGYFNFMQSAAPVLEEFQAPATVYIVTQHMQDGRPLYHHLIEDLVLASPHENMTGSVPPVPGRMPLRTKSERAAVIDAARAAVRACDDDTSRIERFLRDLAGALDVDLDARLKGRVWDCMTPAEVREMSTRGYSMQLHTHSHRNVLADSDTVLREVDTNRVALEAVTEQSADDFCYPTGLWNRSAWEPLRALGVRSAVTTLQGPNLVGTPALALRRVMDGEHASQIEFEFAVSGLAWLWHVLRHPERRAAPSEKVRTYRESPVNY
jgi:peptidoglycan/xylan/chitin deacetylase (PgdA/CDA1 family)